MSRVFVAEEGALGRKVVVKVLPPELSAAVNTDRFRREIQLAANLQHPLIVPVLTAETVNGIPYYTMPFIEGESIRTRLMRSGELPIADVVRILRDVLSALSYAHDHGVIHRDIKPDNVLLSGDHAVITDFGVAKALSAAASSNAGLTSEGVAIGTPLYMSPEQALGDPATDHRADLYAVGAMAYEMLTNSPVFPGRKAQAVLAAHAIEKPDTVSQRRPSVPTALSAVIMRALEKRPTDRPQSARQMLAELEAAVTPGATGPRDRFAVSGDGRIGRFKRPALAALVTAALLLAAIGGYFYSRQRGRTSADRAITNDTGRAPPTTIAVLPFTNTSGDAHEEYFSEGMTDELAHALSGLPSLRVVARASSYAFRNKSASVQEIGSALHATKVVEGTVRRAGNRVRVTAQLSNAADGLVLWSGTNESDARDVFSIQDEFTKKIVSAIAPALREDAAANVAKERRGTADAQAYDLYLKARYHWSRGGAEDLSSAADLFRAAIARDPRFARAHAGLALTYVFLGIAFPLAADSMASLTETTAARALGLDSTAVDAHYALGVNEFFRSRFKDADSHFRAGLTLQPNDAFGREGHADALNMLGDIDGAIREAKAAQAIDPLSFLVANDLAAILFSAGRFREGLEQAQLALRLRPGLATVYQNLAANYLFLGLPDSAVAAVEEGHRLDPRAPHWSSSLLASYAAAGRWNDARRQHAAILAEPEGSEKNYELLYDAVVRGDLHAALAMLEKSATEKNGVFAGGNPGCDPVLAPLRSEPRFRAVMSRLDLAFCQSAPTPWPFKPPPRGFRWDQ